MKRAIVAAALLAGCGAGDEPAPPIETRTMPPLVIRCEWRTVDAVTRICLCCESTLSCRAEPDLSYCAP